MIVNPVCVHCQVRCVRDPQGHCTHCGIHHLQPVMYPSRFTAKTEPPVRRVN